jgi:2'-hydroxyisoflavone reductase
MKKVLILGGTQFVGRSICQHLLQNADLEISLYNRGRSGTELFSELRRIQGDREQLEYDEIAAESWDAIIDCSSYYPNSLAQLLARMSGKVGRYIYISTGSVYDMGEASPPFYEDSKLLSCSEEQRTDETMATYGQRKVACEEELHKSDIPFSILRPSVIYGRWDPYDRHYYWLYRIHKGLDFILPENSTPNSFTDSWDLAEVVRLCLDQQGNHIYNVVSHEPQSTKETCQQIAEKLEKDLDKAITISDDKLAELEIKPGLDLPLFFGNMALQMPSRSLAELRPNPPKFQDALDDLISWYAEKGWPEPVYGMKLNREKEILDAQL